MFSPNATLIIVLGVLQGVKQRKMPLGRNEGELTVDLEQGQVIEGS